VFKNKVKTTVLKVPAKKNVPKTANASIREREIDSIQTTKGDAPVLSPEVGRKPYRPFRLPRFGKNQLLAFVRDLKCLFTFWEITPQTVEITKRELGEEYAGSSMFLRIFKKLADGTFGFLFEREVQPGEMNCYVYLKEEGGSYFLEISQKSGSGRYLVLARSDEVQTGASAHALPPSDPAWEMPGEIREYFKEGAIEQSFQPGKKHFSADLGVQGGLRRRRLGPQDRHTASKF
jgi:hypothetical protein